MKEYFEENLVDDLEESPIGYETVEVEKFNGFGDEEENEEFVHPDNIEEFTGVDYGSEIGETINFDPSEIDSKIEELKSSDGIFDFMGYQDRLEKFPVDLRKEIDEYVYREYSELFRNDEDETKDETVKPTHGGFEDYFDQDEQAFSSHDTRKRNRKSHKGKRNTDLYSPLEGLAA